MALTVPVMIRNVVVTSISRRPRGPWFYALVCDWRLTVTCQPQSANRQHLLVHLIVPHSPLQFPIRADKLSLNASISQEIFSAQTKFQHIKIVNTDVFGKVLLLDGHIQLTIFDEHAYHESLVHIPLLSIPNPTSALVVGGGDGGVIRELARHNDLSRIDMVEIDQGVIDASQTYLPELSNGAFEDPRVTVYVEDAFPFVKNSNHRYDLIVVDSTDTYEEEEGELSAQLFTSEFYRDCLNCLTETGIVVTQADNLVFCPYSLEAILNLFQEVFPVVGSYQALVPSFGGFSGFCWGSRGGQVNIAWSETSQTIAFRYLNHATFSLAFSPLTF